MNSGVGGPSLRWWRPLQRVDRFALVWMVIVPALLFTVPALCGHPPIVGDNLIQNFPLRVLSGRQIGTGHLPLMNIYANSGTPLLGGLNAGALYPMTGIFAFVSPVAAWILNLIVVYVTAAVGMFALLRWHGLRTLSSFAAAMSFSYTGAMIGQVVHLGVAEGFAFIPWAALVMVSLARRLGLLDPTAGWRTCAHTALPSTVGLAMLWGLTFLTGEPRAIAEMELLTLVAVPVILLMRTSYEVRAWRARVVYLAGLAVGISWGAAVAFVQLVPGWSFIGLSQRSSISYDFFGSGSHFVAWFPSTLVQDVFGGNGLWGQAHYFFGVYSYPEVTGYAGILALVATMAFLVQLTPRGWVGAQRDYVLFIALGVVGWFATWGSSTPVGRLFHAIPLFGSARLQSRNIILVDFAASVLLGWWLDRMQARDTRSAGLEGRARWITLSPAVGVAALCVAMFAWGSSIVRSMGVHVRASALANSETLTLALHLTVALATIGCLVRWRGSSNVVRWLLAILAVDVAVFLLFCSTGLVGGNAPVSPSRPDAVSLLGNLGRFALVDESGAHFLQFEELGSPNMNIFTQLPSIQGYGSLISTIYGNSTGTHPVAALNPCALANGSLAQLRLAAVAVSSSELSTMLGANLPPSPTCVAPTQVQSTQRYFGQLLKVRSISVSGFRGRSVATGPVSMQLLDSHGGPLGPAVLQMGAPSMQFDLSAVADPAAGFTLRAAGGVKVVDATVTTRGGAIRYALDTSFQLALSTSSWRLTTTVGTLAVFRATHVSGPAWLEHRAKGSRVTKVRSALWGDAWVSVTASAPVTLVRSMAYLPGWRATALNDSTGASIALTVRRSGIVQEVTVPAGDWTVHFHYHAPYIEMGLIVSIAGTLLWGGVAGTLLWQGRRTRNDKVRS